MLINNRPTLYVIHIYICLVVGMLLFSEILNRWDKEGGWEGGGGGGGGGERRVEE